MKDSECTSLVVNWKAKYHEEVEDHRIAREKTGYYMDCLEVACNMAAEMYRGDLGEYIRDEAMRKVREDLH